VSKAEALCPVAEGEEEACLVCALVEEEEACHVSAQWGRRRHV